MQPRRAAPVDLPDDGLPLVAATLITNGVSWYLRSRLAADARGLRVSFPRTVLGLVPYRRTRFFCPLPGVRRIVIGTKLYPERLAVAVLLGLTTVLGRFGALATGLLGLATVAFLLLSFVAVVRIEMHRRPVESLPVCLAHLPRARRFIAQFERLAADDAGAGSGE